MDSTQGGGIQSMLEGLKRLITLHIDYARLTAAEKLTVLLSTIAFYAMVVVFGAIMLIFLSIGVGHLLAATVAPEVAYLYVAAFYLLIFILLFIFRKKIFVDPVSKFISKLFVKPPTEE